MPESRHERIVAILRAAADAHGLAVAALRGDRCDAKAVAARRAAIAEAFAAGFSAAAIGRALDRDRKTVTHHLRAMEAAQGGLRPGPEPAAVQA